MFNPNYIYYLKNLKRCFLKNGPPLYMLFHVTHRCPAKCRHCFVTDSRRQMGFGDELGLGEIERIVKNMDSLLWLNITGGEPFLREDLPEIIELFYRINKVYIFKVDSNGYFTEKTIKNAEKIAKLTPYAQTTINLSIDDIGQNHDFIRNTPGLFKKVIDTYWGLFEVARKYSNLRISAEVTVSKFNQNNLKNIFNYFTEELKLNNLNHVFTRGVTRDPESGNFEIGKYKEFSELTDKFIYTGKGFILFPYASIINAKNILARRLIARIAAEKNNILACPANLLNATLYSNGDLISCEVKGGIIGNLKDHNYNFRKLWLSKEAVRVRENIKKHKCFCTHECYLNTAILFNLRMLPSILSVAMKINLLKLVHQIFKGGADNNLYLKIRYLFEPAFAAILLILLSPVFLIIAILIKLDSQGPVFYKQVRVGKGGKLFDIIKFRSMREFAEDVNIPVWPVNSDPRATRVGQKLRRCGLDELPQLINIIKGQMSFIGPRPERPYFAGKFSSQIPGYGQRYILKPGITGLSQVMGLRGDCRIEERVKLDLQYCTKLSPLVDIIIIYRTCKIILAGLILNDTERQESGLSK